LFDLAARGAGGLDGPIFEPLRDPAYFAPEFLHERIRTSPPP